MSEQRDGTGTGTWTHPAAETGPPEQRRQCPDCGGAGWHWNRSEFGFVQDACKRCGSTGHIFEPMKCECGQSEFDGRAWSWRGVGTRRVCVANSTLSGYCPGSCGCRLSVEAGEPRVGEKYADLERDAKRFRAVEMAMGSPLDSPFNTHRWHYETDGMDTRYDTLGEYADALGGETDTETGEVEVGPSETKLLAALALELSDHGDCPMDYSDWECPATPETHDCESGPVELCWLIYYGLATTYSDAAALWKWMEEAAKSDE